MTVLIVCSLLLFLMTLVVFKRFWLKRETELLAQKAVELDSIEPLILKLGQKDRAESQFHWAINSLWLGHHRRLAIELCGEAYERYPRDPDIAGWVEKAADIEPELAVELLGDEALSYRSQPNLPTGGDEAPHDPTLVAIELQEHERCPFCRGDFLSDESVVDCPQCSARYHLECWDELQHKCGTFGCASS